MTLESPQIPQEEFKIINGKKYKKVPSGYTVRQYYSNETPEMGPGPGWSMMAFGSDIVAEEYGIKVDGKTPAWIRPSDLPDDPHYIWEEVTE